MRKAVGRIGIAAVCAVIALVLCGFVYEEIGRARDLRRLPPRVGRAIDVGGGRTINIYCSGSGAPTVVFESGGRGLGYDWVQVQAEVAKVTRACWYDRAAQGWSDTPAHPLNSRATVEDLHRALEGAQARPPYVLVGASVGGEYARIFTAAYPGEVAGLVFVDSSVPDQKEPPALRGPANKLPIWQRRVLCAAAPFAARLGVLRLIMPARVPVPGRFTEQQRRVYAALQKQPRSFATEAAKECAATNGGRINRDCGTGNPDVDDAARASGNLGDRPLIVLTAGQEISSPANEEEMQVAQFHRVWVNDLQPSLARLSTHGRQIVVGDADHGIQFSDPEAVLSAVREVVEQVRKTQ